MAMELYVSASRAGLPTSAEVESAARALGFALRVDGLDWSALSGFLPMTVNGRQGGVEVDLVGPSEAGIEAACPEGHDVAVAFRWGGDALEGACAMIGAASLAACTGGLIFDPQEGADLSGATAVACAHELLAGTE